MKEQLCHGSRGTEKAPVSDEQLVERFAVSQDEQAFRQLVERHGGLVLGVCRRRLRDEHDAEEAFQATFMVLAKKAGRLTAPGAVSAWLYGVAYRTASRVARRRDRRREESLVEEIMSDDDVFQQVTDAHRQRVLDEELGALAERYREPLVLHYLLGKTNPQIAKLLDLSIRTVEGRQRRGKKLLRRRLALRKVSLSLAVVALAGACQTAQAAPTASLLTSSVTASLSYAAGGAAPDCSHETLHLAQQETLVMSLPIALTSSACVVLLIVGAAFSQVGDDPFGNGKTKPGISSETTTPELNAQQIAKKSDSPFDAAIRSASSTGESKPNPKATSPPSNTIPASPTSFDLKRYEPSERKIILALANETPPIEFIETPLAEVVEYLVDAKGILIWLDRAAMGEAGIRSDVPITASLRGIKLNSALRLLLREYGLTFVVQDEVLIITTQKQSDEMIETRVYDLSPYHFTDAETIDLTKILPKAVRPTSWNSEESSSARKKSIEALGQNLIITQTQAVHNEIGALLEQLIRSKSRDGSQTGGSVSSQ